LQAAKRSCSALQRSPFGPAPLQSLHPYCELLRLCAPLRYSGPCGWRAAWTSPLASERQVLTFRTRAWLSFAPSTCRMPLGQASGFSRADPGGRVTPRFRHRLIRFRHFIDGSLALASLNLACRDHGPDVSATLPSRPGEFHPEPLTDPDVTLSRHPARATERRLPPPVENWSSSCCQLAHSQRR
jgi:hypothetical protein